MRHLIWWAAAEWTSLTVFCTLQVSCPHQFLYLWRSSFLLPNARYLLLTNLRGNPSLWNDCCFSLCFCRWFSSLEHITALSLSFQRLMICWARCSVWFFFESLRHLSCVALTCISSTVQSHEVQDTAIQIDIVCSLRNYCQFSTST